MTILGIYPSHDSGAALLNDEGEILAAINEGRLIGEKLFWGFPEKSIKTVFDIAGRSPTDVSQVAVGGQHIAIGKRKSFDEVPTKKRLMELLSFLPFTGGHLFSKIGRRLFTAAREDEVWESRLESVGVNAPVRFFDHHYSHAASTYYTSPFEEDTLILTLDAQGDFRSSTIYTVSDNHKLEIESWTPFYHSMGKYWSYVTFNLGFTPMRHEGKISGLAAQGDPSECIDVFRNYMNVDKDALEFRSRIGCWNNPAAKRLHRDLQGTNWADVAAALQLRTEEVVCELVDEAMKRFDCSTLALAGGVFANVKLNQELVKIDSVSDVYIHPHMGDGGLAVGGAYAHWAEQKLKSGETPEPQFIDTVYHGTETTAAEIASALDEAGLEYEHRSDTEDRIGELLAKGYVVGRYNGALEYGPRALGNRSIIAAPTDPSCQDWLNERLDRTEFMPFAPSILESHIDDFYVDTSAGTHAGKFMTINFDATDHGKKSAPAVIHIDETSRPQIVVEADNPSYHSIIESFRKRTGLPILLNTSFNAHGKPIVNSPEEAIDAYEKGMIDALAIDDFVVLSTDQSPSIVTV